MPENDSAGALRRAQELHRAGRLRDAAGVYRAALQNAPGDAGLHEWYGALCLQMGKGRDALEELKTAAQLQPENFSYFENLAGAAVRLGQTQLALLAFQRALTLKPDEGEMRRFYVRLLLKAGQPDAAMEALEPMVHSDPVLQARCRNPDRAVAQEARQQIIIDNCRQILARFPNYAPAHYALACAHLVLGHMADALAAAQAAIGINPGLPVYYHVALTAGNKAQKQAAVAALEGLRPKADAMPRAGAAMLHFLLAGAYDKAGRYADAFAEMETGNRIKRALISYDGLAALSEMRHIADQFPTPASGTAHGRHTERAARPADLATRPAGPATCPAASADALRPVFVVGMYRSGTSLVEQILASHPDVYGAGEVIFFPEVLAEVQKSTGYTDPADFTDADFTRIGDLYRARLKACSPQSPVIVDKLPDNFLRLGWIRCALPEARIIHVARDPLDCCLSCYAHMFAGDIGYAYDLTELGQYYRGYSGLMRHWEATLPAGTFHTVSYEDLVRAPDATIRNLVSWSGLSWNPACLSFSETRRAVATASVGEVRRPLYSQSVGRAGPYLRWLSPLIRALG